MFVIRTKNKGIVNKWRGHVYVLDPDTGKPKMFYTRDEATAYLKQSSETDEVLNTLEIISETDDIITHLTAIGMDKTQKSR